MGDPTSRRNQTRNRLRAQLRKKRESLADQFDFKIYIAFVFKEKVCQSNLKSTIIPDNLKTHLPATVFLSICPSHTHTRPRQTNVLNMHLCICFFVITEEEVCTFRSSWSCAGDDQQLWRKHLKRCAGLELLSREFDRTPAKRCCATTRAPIPVNAKGKLVYHLRSR